MALENTDLIIVGRGSTSYQTTYQNLADSINASGGVGVGSTPGINEVLGAYNLADLGQVLRFKVGAGNTSPGISTDSLPSLLGAGAGAAHRALYSSYSDTLDSTNPRHTDITAYGFKTYDIASDLSPHGSIAMNPEWGIQGYSKRTGIEYGFSAGAYGFEYASDNDNHEYRISSGRPSQYNADSVVLELASPVSKLNTQESNALVVSRYGDPGGPTNDFVITTDGNVSAGGSIGIAGTFYGDGSGLTNLPNVGSSSSIRDVLAAGNQAGNFQVLRFRDPNTSGIPTSILDEDTVNELNNLYITGSHRAAWSNLSAIDVNDDQTAYNNNLSFEGINVQYQSSFLNNFRQFHATAEGMYGVSRRDSFDGEYYYGMNAQIFEHEFTKEYGDTTLYENTVFSRLHFNPQSDSFSNAYGGQGLSLTYHPDSRAGTISTNPSVAISIGTTSNFDGWADYTDNIDFQVKTDGTVITSSSITAASFNGDGSGLTNVGSNPHPGTRYNYNNQIASASNINDLGDGEFWIDASGGNFDIWVAAVDSQGTDQFGNINASFTHTYNPKQIFTIRDNYNGAPVRHGQFEIISVSNQSSGRKIKFECGATATNLFLNGGGSLQNGDEYSLDITGWL